MHEEPLGRISRYFVAWDYNIINKPINKLYKLKENPDFTEDLMWSNFSDNEKKE